MKTIKVVLIMAIFVVSAKLQAQVGINTVTPDTTAALHIVGAEKGVLFPEMDEASRRRVVLGSLEVGDGLLAYDPIQKVLYIRNKTIKEWTVVNPFRIGHDRDGKYTHVRLATQFRNDSIYIGPDINKRAEAKLHVDGTFKAIGNSRIEGTLDVAGNINLTDVENVFTITSGLNQIKLSHTNTTLNKTSINGDLNVTGVITGAGTIPIGGIIMWSGTTPPEGWALCNGQTVNSIITPNLQGRFIVGAGTQTEKTDNKETVVPSYAIHNKGGYNKYILSKDEMPTHVHDAVNGRGLGFFVTSHYERAEKGDAGGHTCGYQKAAAVVFETQPTGGSQSHENRPPYYALAYIMRIK